MLFYLWLCVFVFYRLNMCLFLRLISLLSLFMFMRIMLFIGLAIICRLYSLCMYLFYFVACFLALWILMLALFVLLSAVDCYMDFIEFSFYAIVFLFVYSYGFLFNLHVWLRGASLATLCFRRVSDMQASQPCVHASQPGVLRGCLICKPRNPMFYEGFWCASLALLFYECEACTSIKSGKTGIAFGDFNPYPW